MRKNYKSISCLLTAALVLTAAPFHADALTKPKLNKKKLTMRVGQKKKLAIKNKKASQIKKIKFTVKKKNIARVNKKGVVTALNEGNTKLVCKVTLKNKKTYKLNCKITVKEAESTVSTATPGASAAAGVAGTPAASTAASVKPGSPSMKPNASGTPVHTDAPDVTQKPSAGPDGSITPDNTDAPADTAKPDNTPETSKAPADTAKPDNPPETSKAPADTAKPDNTPDTSKAPADTAKPDNTPAASKTPADTAKPDNTPASTDTPDTPGTPSPSSQGPHLSANGILTSDNGVMRTGIDAYDIVKEMGAGTNLGNTLESCGTGIGTTSTSNYETAWGQPITTQEMIDGMKAAGFDSIRIPVAWSNMMANDGTYTINEKYFNRVETVLNYALNADMYVIINIHFDSGWWARFGSKTEQERKDAMTKYKTMWTQIANRFQEYSDRLIFESANEELGTRLNSTDDYKGSGYYAKDDLDSLYKLTNEINQTFVDIVRSTGGNNAKRFLLIAGYDTDISKTCDLRYKMPTDTIDSHLMVSIHYYSPYTYCITDNPQKTGEYDASWGTDEDIKALQGELSQMRISFVNKGYPVIIGEYGVTDTKISENNFVRKEGRDLFFRSVCEFALENNMCPILWDCSQVFDRRNLTMTNEAEKALYIEMNEKAHHSELVKPSVSDDSYHWTGTVANSNWSASSASASDLNSTFVIFKNGGCFTISGIDWSGFKNPVLKLTCKESSGTALFRLANQVDTSNQYWYHLYDNGTGVISEKNISSGSTISINIPLDDMTATQNLYFALANSSDFNGTISVEVVEN
jgi:aryl-phospho-beta-D-glucosidase BglC (GH1 family)